VVISAAPQRLGFYNLMNDDWQQYYPHGKNIFSIGYRLINAGKIFSSMDKSFIPMGKIENATFFCFVHKGKIFFQKG
jgi:hypothetical protein